VAAEPAAAASGPSGTELTVAMVGEDGRPGGQLRVTVNRVLRPDGAGQDGPGRAAGSLFADWRLADGALVRGCLAAARYIAEGTD
jgi:hypothetical protein